MRLLTNSVIILSCCIAAFVASGSTAAASAPRAVVADDSFGPTTVLENVDLVVKHVSPYDTVTTTMHRRGDQQFRETAVMLGEFGFVTTQNYVRGIYAFGNGRSHALRQGFFIRNHARVEPDGYDPFVDNVYGYVMPFLARQRSGERVLTESTLDGRQVLHGSMPLTANQCAGQRAGTRTIDIDPETFVPIRIVDARATTKVETTTISTITGVSQNLSALKFVGPRTTMDLKYFRRSAALSASVLPFPVALPARVPTGFTLDHTEMARVGGKIGPEGSFSASRGVFAARWSRGFEPLELTIRGAAGTLITDWKYSDPFGVECGASETQAVRVQGVQGQYGRGDFRGARLWWRKNRTLYTLSGAFSSAELVRIANSMRTVAATN